MYIIITRFVALQLQQSEGQNIVVCCNNGRSRSPMYLVAYLMLCCDMSVDDAMTIVRNELFEQREEVLDRCSALRPAMSHLCIV